MLFFPALFFLDTSSTCWLWQGYFPKVSGDANGNDVTGSCFIRWHAERRAAMETAKNYLDMKYGNERGNDGQTRPLSARPPAKLVWAGLEPEEFKACFPVWDQDYVDNIPFDRQQVFIPGILFETGFSCVASQDVQDDCLVSTLIKLSKTSYTWEELQERPLPDGVDPSRLETYLSREDFEVRKWTEIISLSYR